MALSNQLILSLIAFNGSTNCNKENAEEFLKSYMERKIVIIGKKKQAYDKNLKVNKEKFIKEYSYIEELTEKYDEALKFISIFLKKEENNKIKIDEFLKKYSYLFRTEDKK